MPTCWVHETREWPRPRRHRRRALETLAERSKGTFELSSATCVHRNRKSPGLPRRPPPPRHGVRTGDGSSDSRRSWAASSVAVRRRQRPRTALRLRGCTASTPCRDSSTAPTTKPTVLSPANMRSPSTPSVGRSRTSWAHCSANANPFGRGATSTERAFSCARSQKRNARLPARVMARRARALNRRRCHAEASGARASTRWRDDLEPSEPNADLERRAHASLTVWGTVFRRPPCVTMIEGRCPALCMGCSSFRSCFWLSAVRKVSSPTIFGLGQPS